MSTAHLSLKVASMKEEQPSRDFVDKVTYKFAKKKDRPRQNTIFLLACLAAGVGLVIAMPILVSFVTQREMHW